MPWPVHPTGFFGARGDQDTYQIERSLRFNSADSAYLSRTPASAGNRKTWTWSGWVKLSDVGANSKGLFFSNTTVETNGATYLMFYGGTNSLKFGTYESGVTKIWETTSLYRDISSWYHIILAFDTTQATNSNRVKIYVNGVQVTAFATQDTISQNYDSSINNTVIHEIGLIRNSFGTRSAFLDGYLTEINFIDGQALTPSSFGETDAITGRWKAKAYSGTYGTNGFYLKFADNSGTTSTTLGKDLSGNGNNWTPNNFSVTAGADNDSLVDSPTNYGTDSGVGGEVRGNYCTLNPLGPKVGLAPTSSGYGIAGGKDGNLVAYAEAGGSALWISATQAMNTGKWYWEQTLNDATYAHDGVGIKEVEVYQNTTNYYWAQTIDGFFVFKNNGDKKTGSTSTSITSSLSNGNVVGVAFDADNSKLWFSVNGTWLDSGVPSTGSNPAFSSASGISTLKSYVPVLACCGNQVAGNNVWACNFGQRPFAYTAPSGFKALCTTNLDKTIGITTTGTFTGNANADGPFVYLNGVPTAMTINGNAVTFQTHADKLSNGFKVRTNSTSYNASGSNTFSVSTTAEKFKYARAQSN